MRRASGSVLLVLLATYSAAAQEPSGRLKGLPGLSLAAGDAFTDRLENLPGFTVIDELPSPAPGYRQFVLEYEQLVDHLKPWRGTFTQRVELSHRSEDEPTVVVTEGYFLFLGIGLSQVTQIVEGNQVRIEHRFFESSRPDPTDWNDLNIFQAASDHHSIVSTLKEIYDGAWLATGDSKGGMASVYFRRFYPNDVRGTVAYVAPNDVIDGSDSYIQFIDNIGNNPGCRAALEELQRQALLRREEMLRMMVEQAEAFGITFDHVFGTPELAFELGVLELPFVFWQFGVQASCNFLPPPNASTQAIFNFIDGVVGFLNYSDQVYGGLFAPNFYQAATQFGFPTIKEGHLKGLLLFHGADVAATYVPPEIDIPHFDKLAMMDIDLFVRMQGERLLFIYGELDPWSAEPFRLGPGTRDSFVYVAPGTSHGAHIGSLPPAQAAEAMATIRRWAGLRGAAALLGTRVPEPELERKQPKLHPRLRTTYWNRLDGRVPYSMLGLDGAEMVILDDWSEIDELGLGRGKRSIQDFMLGREFRRD